MTIAAGAATASAAASCGRPPCREPSTCRRVTPRLRREHPDLGGSMPLEGPSTLDEMARVQVRS